MQEFEHGLVIGKFYPPHKGHSYLIRTASNFCNFVTVIVMAADVERIPMHDRVNWLRETFTDYPNIRVVGIIDNVRVDYEDSTIWQQHVDLMRVGIANANIEFEKAPSVDAVFTSEDYGNELSNYFNAANVCLDKARLLYPISGTLSRSHLIENWNLLERSVQTGLSRTVVVLGSESTGTTTLAKDLTKYFQSKGGAWENTTYISEFGREYSWNKIAIQRSKLNRKSLSPMQDITWSPQEFLTIAQQQTAWELDARKSGVPLVISDTDALATCVWHSRYLVSSNIELEEYVRRAPSKFLYLLTDVKNVPFVQDGLRDGEHIRQSMQDQFISKLQSQNAPWYLITGSKQERLDMASTIIENAMNNFWNI